MKVFKIYEQTFSNFKNELYGMNADSIKHAFFSNYLACLILLKLNYPHCKTLFQGHIDVKLRRYPKKSPDIMFWGKALFYPDDTLKNINYGHLDVLEKEAGRILDSRVVKTMSVLIADPKRIDWVFTCTNLALLKHRFDLNSTYFDNIVYGLYKWDEISESRRRSLVSKAFIYLQQSDNKSNLLAPLRSVTTKSATALDSIIGGLFMKVIGYTKLFEDETISTGEIATNNAILGLLDNENKPTPMQKWDLGVDSNIGSKIPSRFRKRKFKPVLIKVPEHMKGSNT